MVKRVRKTAKNHPVKKRKKIIIAGTEGNNKTESQYLRFLEKNQSEYHFIFASGNETDPVKIVKNTIKKAGAEEISVRHGDMAVSIFDLDNDNSKKQQLNQARVIAARHNVSIISSNPCFEVWYLEHFGFTSKPFTGSSEVITELKKHMPDYQKNRCDFTSLFSLTDAAVENCERLDRYHAQSGSKEVFEFHNPRTDVYRIVKKIIQAMDEKNIRLKN